MNLMGVFFNVLGWMLAIVLIASVMMFSVAFLVQHVLPVGP